MEQHDDEQTNAPNNIVYQKFKLSLAPLHGCNILFESVLLFLCQSHPAVAAQGEFCKDLFMFGNGALLSMIALVIGEAEHPLSLHGLAWYHGIGFYLNVRRLVLQGMSFASERWVLAGLLGNFFLFVIPCMILIQNKLLELDVLFGIVASALYLVSNGLQYPVIRSIIKTIPVVIMSIRVKWGDKDDRFARLVKVSLVVCAVADFLIEFSFVAGLGCFLLAHVLYVWAFTMENKALEIGRVVPFAVWGVCVYSVFFPKLDSLKIPVALYVIAISSMIWRASVLATSSSGRAIALGALSFACSDSLIGIDKFVSPIENRSYPILGLYWMGQAMIVRGIEMRDIAKEAKQSEEKKTE